MMKVRTRAATMLSIGCIGALALSACAPTTTTEGNLGGEGASGVVESDDIPAFSSAQEIADYYPTSDYCGEGEVTLGVPLGAGVSWLLTANAMIEKELAEHCPNVSIQVTDAQGDPQKANSDINSLVAQGVDGLMIDPLFGESQVPAMKSATDAGVPVVTYVQSGGAQAGQDIVANVPVYMPENGKLWTEFIDESLGGEGTVVFLGGDAGQTSSIANMDAIKAELANYPGLTLVEEEFQPIKNSAAEASRVMAGLLAAHGRIDAVITDNGTVTAPILDAYAQAGFEMPTLAVSATSNGLNCEWEARGESYDFFSTDGNQSTVFPALRLLLAEINGLEIDEPTQVKPFPVVDTLSDSPPKCDSSVSPDIDWSTTLSTDEMTELFA